MTAVIILPLVYYIYQNIYVTEESFSALLIQHKYINICFIRVSIALNIPSHMPFSLFDHKWLVPTRN